MTFPIRPFGSPKTTDNVEELYAKLHADDLHGWQRRNSRLEAPLDPWIRDNILHAIEACPRVLAYWKLSKPSAVVDRTLYRYVGAALEGLADEKKIAVLSGVCKGKAQNELFDCINGRAANWMALSPAWIGAPGSDLRRAAVKCGWSDIHLLGQVFHSISRPEAERWAAWVPYAHSIAFFQRGGRVAYEREHASPEGLKPIETTGQAWANAEDMALAQSLIKHMPHYSYTLIPHSHAIPVSAELQERMDALVAVHAGLGMMFTLQKMVLVGTLPAVHNDIAMDLPELGL